MTAASARPAAAGRLEKRSVSLAGHPTSVALEPEFWRALEAMGAEEALVATLARIDAARGPRPLASACRVAALTWALARAGLLDAERLQEP